MHPPLRTKPVFDIGTVGEHAFLEIDELAAQACL
jgi:hypothetical protein